MNCAVIEILEGTSFMELDTAALEQKREKTRALKQGMTQELLAGNTRLN